MLKTTRCVFNLKLEGNIMISPSILFSIAGWISLAAALISSVCWILLSIAWWRMENKRIKKNKESQF